MNPQTNPEETERLRICLLQQLRAAGDASLPLPTLATGATLAGFEAITATQLRNELAYLVDKSLVVVAAKLLSPENRRWRITAAGRDFLAESGI